MYFSIQYQTRYRYASPVSESIMELRMQPRSEGRQRSHSFLLKVNPKARVLRYRDHLGNMIHHFNVAAKHTQLLIIADMIVETYAPEPLPEGLPANSWQQLDDILAREDYWEFIMPSDFTEPTPMLEDLAQELKAERRVDPLTLVRELNTAIYKAFDYVPKHTSVNSPIDHALTDRKGVCQDFAHIFTALLRRIHIPCRYVSGYVYHRREDHDRSADGATHAWVEAMLPGLGWVGFDPTNNLIVGERHIRTAIGRDYSDVPPTRGLFRGNAQSEMSAMVRVTKTEAPTEDPAKELLFNSNPPVFEERPPVNESAVAQQQQQQQQ